MDRERKNPLPSASSSSPSAGQSPGGQPGGTAAAAPGQPVPTLAFSRAEAPAIGLPKGGGAVRGIGEKFQVSPATGTGSLAVPLPLSPSRPGGLAPALSLAYDSGAGNSVFGLGWNVGIPSIQRKTEKRVPVYDDDVDVFVLAGAEDLTPDPAGPTTDGDFSVLRYRPRIDGSFSRIERRRHTVTGDVHFRVTTPDNVTHVYGQTAPGRIADPESPGRIFSWLLCRSTDDRGNIVVYEYEDEDLLNVPAGVPHEAARHAGKAPFANKHLKRVRYANTTPHDPSTCMIEVVFDYGDHDLPAPVPGPTPGLSWSVREDPFSTGRAGFEMRTYRLCRRVLVFHGFPELGQTPVLVRSLELTHDPSPAATRLIALTQRGYVQEPGGAYTSQALPPLTFEYSVPALDFTVRALDAGSLEDVSTGTLAAAAQWVDLDGEGLSGLLFEQGGALHYKRNLGQGALAPARRLETQPSMAMLGEGILDVRDAGGSGEQAMVALTRPVAGFFSRSEEGEWEPFRPFLHQPTVDVTDPNVRFLDLNGDGLDDLVVARGDTFFWYPSRGKEGYDAPRTFPLPKAEDRGPVRVFSDGTGTLFLGDMTGDGLADIVRVTAGRVSYWPNLGHGRFGAETVMSGCPRLDSGEAFDPGRVRLADLDGSGPADLVYADAGGLRVFFNQAGNRWSEAHEIPAFPTAAALRTLSVADLLGTGTACILWRNTLTNRPDEPLRCIDLLSGKKPHLLVRTDNHMGLETRTAYAPSTRFYLADRAAGRPWATRLPFVVHVVERVEHYEAVTRSRLVTTYTYHHGCYDGDEREFRGFGRVEQRDTESVADSWGQGLFTDKPPPQNGELVRPPVLSKTWLHPGVIRGRKRIEEVYRAEYYSLDPQNPDPRLLPDTLLPEGLGAAERRQAYRALKGQVLRTEVYALDGSAKEPHPYAVTEHAYTLRKEQPEFSSLKGTKHPAVFSVHGREVVQIAYERNPADPRVSHQMALEIDPYGHVTREATLAYGRVAGPGVHEEQLKTWIAVAEHTLAAVTGSSAGWRHGLPIESRLHELHGLAAPPAGGLHAFAAVSDAAATAAPIGYTDTLTGALEKRLLGHVRHLYASDADPQNPLPPGQVELLALPYESHSLAFTAADLAEYDGRVTSAMLQEGGYVELTAGQWWAPSGRAVLDPQTFYLPVQVIDPFGGITSIGYDAGAFVATAVTDALGNAVTAELDYRVLAPRLVTDANGNRSAAAFDALGRVVAAAVMGKVGSSDGDTLADPSAKFTYELGAWDTSERPNHVKSEARETHGDPQSRWQVAYSYTDGLGRVAMVKAQAEPGLAPQRDAGGNLVYDSGGALVYTLVAERWAGTGRTVFDNKGQPVKQYEPYFSSVPDFEDEADLVQQGVTPLLRHDPLGRLIRTDLPDGTVSRTEFDAWSQTAWDPNDTSGEAGNAWTAARQPGAVPAPSAEEQRAATLSLAHADTPATTHVDALGRVFLAQARLDGATVAETRTELDIEGQVLAVRDALKDGQGMGRVCAQSVSAIGGQVMRSSHVDSGEGLALADVLGAPLYAWDALGHRVRTEFDVLRRPTHVWVKKGSDPEWLSQRLVYGEAAAQPEVANLRGKGLYHFDGAGLAATGAYDFKGNLLSASRRLAVTYTGEPDWSALAGITDPAAIMTAATSLLESETFSKATTYDALNRPVTMTQPDSSVILPSYNEAGLLDGVGVKIRGAAVATTFVANIDYDVKGRREKIEYGNGATTTYDHDPISYRLTRIKTTRASDSAVLQNLSYTYDAVGNIVAIADTAHETVFFAGQQVTPSAEYEYDALYRLVKATGREHAGGVGDDQRDHNDLPLWNLPHPNDAQALRNYEEHYDYDLVGNILELVHTALGSAVGSWTRRYAYGQNPFDPGAPAVPANNRLHSTSLPGDAAAGPFTATVTHDANGNMTAMPHLASIAYTHTNQMRQADLGGGGTAYYTYDAGGERVRKVIQRLGTTREERIYLGGWELYRKRQGANGDLVLERETLHVMDDARRIALVETKTVDADGPGPLTIVPRIRYQVDNHLGTATLEVDETGLVISYEEYHPYGTSAYRSARSGVEVSDKRYRYTGKERDDETGFGYHSARYYAPWLARWTSADPAGMVDGSNLYAYARSSPIALCDPSGTDSFAGLDTTGKCPFTVTYPNFDAYAASGAGSSYTINEDGSYTATKWLQCAPSSPASAPPESTASTPAVKKAPQPAPAVTPLTVDELLKLSAALGPHYRYDPSVHRVLGTLQMAGGGLEILGGVVALGAPEPTLTTKVAGGIVIAHGADQVGTGFGQLLSGKPTPTYMFRISAEVAQIAGMNPEDAAVIGRINDQLFGIAAAAGGLALAATPAKLTAPLTKGPNADFSLPRGGGQQPFDLAKLGRIQASLQKRGVSFVHR